MLDAKEDPYGGVVVNDAALPSDPAKFGKVLTASLAAWTNKGKRGVWLKVPKVKTALLPVAIEAGFAIHHAQPLYVMLTHWLVDEPNNLPGYATHFAGVGGVVFNKRGEVLVVAERFDVGVQDSLGGDKLCWKFPGGLVDAGEELHEAVAREVFEETGIEVEFESIICCRHLKRYRFGRCDIYIAMRCTPKDETAEIKMDPKEIKACSWKPVETLFADPLFVGMNRRVLHLATQQTKTELQLHAYKSSISGKSTPLFHGAVADESLQCKGAATTARRSIGLAAAFTSVAICCLLYARPQK
jgi:8-oxo-dGTP pyrophosphatase MutT (NUDIX family)